MIVDLHGCRFQPYRVTPVLERVARILGLRVLDRCEHRFGTVKRNGETAILLLAESHMSLHSWPEKGYAAFDLFSCKELPAAAAAKAVAALVRAFGCKDHELKVVDRGK